MSLQHTTQSLQQEGRIALAIAALQKGQLRSVTSAAKLYDVPLATLQRRVQGQHARCDTRLSNCKLSDTEELTLVEWILSMD